MPILASETLHALIRAVCAAGGSIEREPELVADQLVEANLTGHDSHGVGMLPAYVQGLKKGALRPNRHAEVVRERNAVVVVDGGRGYGQVIGHEAMQLGMARAQEAILYEKASAFGTIVVRQDGAMRTLHFGRDGVRQSLVKLGDPGYLGLAYTRVALAGLALSAESRRLLVVGLDLA